MISQYCIILVLIVILLLPPFLKNFVWFISHYCRSFWNQKDKFPFLGIISSNLTLTLILPAVNSLPQINTENTDMISFELHNTDIYHISIYIFSCLCLIKSYAHTPSAEIKQRKLTKGWGKLESETKPSGWAVHRSLPILAKQQF